MRKNTLLCFVQILICYCSIAQPAPLPPLPSPQQVKWKATEFYFFIHFGPNTFTNKEWGEGKEDPALFNPTAMDCRQWARIAKKAGAKGIVLTAKHHDGFCLWPSAYSTHTVRESPWKNGKGDVVKELSQACKAEGLLFGIYISPWDRNHPAYGTPAYNDVYVSTMKELLTRYGKLFELWWDGANGEGPNGKKQVYDFKRFQDSVFKWQPQVIIFSDIGPGARWCGNESGFINETNWSLLDTAGFARGNGAPPTDTLNRGNFNGRNWIPAEVDVSIRPGWFYHKEEDSKVKSPDALMKIYLESVGRGANLILNVPLDRRGLINEADSASLVAFGRRLRELTKTNLALRKKATLSEAGKSRPAAHLTDGDRTSMIASTTTAPVFELDLGKEIEFNHLLLQEYIESGQRVISFVVKYWKDGEWKELTSGTTIGYKRLLKFEKTKAQKLRIEIRQSKAPVVLGEIAIYNN